MTINAVSNQALATTSAPKFSTFYNSANNTAVGTSAGTSDITTDTSTQNTLIGPSAGSSISNTGAQLITAVGYQAVQNATNQASITGIGSLACKNTRGGSVTAVGYRAAQGSGTPASNTGVNIVAIGDSTLQNYTTATYCTAVGSNAGNALTTSSNSTLIGGLAGFLITTGSDNTLVGYNSGAAYTTQSGATAFGKDALRVSTNSDTHAFGYQAGLNSAGSGSVYIGYQAGFGTGGATNDNFNTVVGYQAFSNYTSGAQQNCGFGFNSINKITTGDDISGFGYQSCYNNTTGTKNSGFGSEALFNISTGTDNTGCGANAGIGITSASSQNTFIGSGADASSATSTNRTALGYNAVSDADNQIMLGNVSVTTIVKNSGATCSLGTTTNRFSVIYSNDFKYGANNYSAAMFKIETKTASSSATIDFTDLPVSQFNSFHIVITGLRPATDSVDLRFRTSPNTGGSPTFDTGASDYEYAWQLINTTPAQGSDGSASAAFIGLLTNWGNTVARSGRGYVDLFDPAVSFPCHIKFHFNNKNDTGVFRTNDGGGMRVSSAAVNAIRFYFSSGNIAEGKFTLYGIL